MFNQHGSHRISRCPGRRATVISGVKADPPEAGRPDLAMASVDRALVLSRQATPLEYAADVALTTVFGTDEEYEHGFERPPHSPLFKQSDDCGDSAQDSGNRPYRIPRQIPLLLVKSGYELRASPLQ